MPEQAATKSQLAKWLSIKRCWKRAGLGSMRGRKCHHTNSMHRFRHILRRQGVRDRLTPCRAFCMLVGLFVCSLGALPSSPSVEQKKGSLDELAGQAAKA